MLTAPGAGDSETLTGCIALRGANVSAVLVGDVDDAVREEAALTATVPTTAAMFQLRAARTPAGAVDATSIRLRDAGGAPPELAATGDLARCAAPVTCADLGLAMPLPRRRHDPSNDPARLQAPDRPHSFSLSASSPNPGTGPTAASTREWPRSSPTASSPGATKERREGQVTLVLTAPGPGDSETLTGCLALRGASLAAVLVGDVDDQTREEAALSVTVPATGAMFGLRAVRAPAGSVDATSIRLSDAGGAPPELAATGDLLRCAVPVTCADLGLSMPFAPENP
ncbi:MAG: hypothetical protein R2991_09095 [Thermoanaerobaculia bacterium]